MQNIIGKTVRPIDSERLVKIRSIQAHEYKTMLDHALALKGPLRVEVFKDNAVGRPFYERNGFVYEEEYLHEPSGAVTFKMAMPSS